MSQLRRYVRSVLETSMLREGGGGSDIDDVVSHAMQLAQKLADAEEGQARTMLASGVVKELQGELAHALAQEGVEDLTKSDVDALVTKLQGRMVHLASDAEFDVAEADDALPPGSKWVDDANQLGNIVDAAANGAAFVLMLPFLLVAGAAELLGSTASGARELPYEWRDPMNAVINAAELGSGKAMDWVERHSDDVEEIYRKLRGVGGKLKADRKFVQEFVAAYEELSGD